MVWFESVCGEWDLEFVSDHLIAGWTDDQVDSSAGGQEDFQQSDPVGRPAGSGYRHHQFA